MAATQTMKKFGMFLLKFTGVLVLFLVALLVGTMIGYSIIGQGGNPLDVFDPQLWGHLLDFFI